MATRWSKDHIQYNRNIRSQDYSFPGTFVPMMELSFSRPFESFLGTIVPWTVRSLELSFSRLYSFPGTFVPWTVRSMELSFPGTFVPGSWTFPAADLYTLHGCIGAWWTSRSGTTGWTVAVVGAIWTCTNWPRRFCSRSLRTSACRLHWCLRHVCAGTSGRHISACKGGWRQCGRLTRPDSWQRRHCSASARVCSGS